LLVQLNNTKSNEKPHYKKVWFLLCCAIIMSRW